MLNCAASGSSEQKNGLDFIFFFLASRDFTSSMQIECVTWYFDNRLRSELELELNSELDAELESLIISQERR